MLADYILGLALGFGLDLLIGWPAALYARIGHPVGWFARPLSAFERRFNHGPSTLLRGFLGAAISLGLIAASIGLWGGLSAIMNGSPWAPLWYGLLFWPLIAARSMHEHVAAIATPLWRNDLPAARHAVSMIVGRNPDKLDQPGIARAALESLAENTSDGIVAPMFYGLLFGPAGMAGYKAINTLDSMIAHRNPRYEWFGKLAAWLDDIANLIPARLTALIYAIAGRVRGSGFKTILRDAPRHRSPNAGWPETALAVALGVRLSGPRIYDDRVVNEPWLNAHCPDPNAVSASEGLRIYRRLLICLALLLALTYSVLA